MPTLTKPHVWYVHTCNVSDSSFSYFHTFHILILFHIYDHRSTQITRTFILVMHDGVGPWRKPGRLSIRGRVKFSPLRVVKANERNKQLDNDIEKHKYMQTCQRVAVNLPTNLNNTKRTQMQKQRWKYLFLSGQLKALGHGGTIENVYTKAYAKY